MNIQEAYILGFDKKEFERNSRRLEAQLQSYTDLDIFGLNPGSENGEETKKKIWSYLRDKNFVESNKHILMNFIGFQSVRETIKIMEDNDPLSKDLGATENAAALKLQRFYRRILMNRYLNKHAGKDNKITAKDSASMILANSVRGKTYSKFTKAYERMMISEEELRRESTNDLLFIKTIPRIQFPNTPLEAKAHVFHNKRDPKEKSIDVEIIMPIIGMHDYIRIPEAEIGQNIKSATFLKKIDEQLINKLEYNPLLKKVFFCREGVNKEDESGQVKDFRSKVNPYLQAKLTRLKYLRRKARTKDMLLLKIQTRDIERMYVNMSYYWFSLKRQLRVMVEHIDALTHYKEIIIKFDNLHNTSDLRGLINEINVDPKEFTKKFKPYLEYIASHIILQPDSKARSNAKEFKILIDSNIFTLDFANSKFVLASLKDISQEVLNNIIVKPGQLDIKSLLRANRLIDVKQFEHAFNNKVNLMGTFDPEKALEIHRNSIGAEIATETVNRADSKKLAEHEPRKPLTREELTKAATIIQKMYKKHQQEERFNIWKLSRQFGKKMLEGYGPKIKRVAKKIENMYWMVTVYKKILDEQNVTNYYFTASSVREAGKKLFAKGIYRADNMLLINSQGKGLVEFLLDRIEINGQTIEFNFNFDNQSNFGKKITFKVFLYF